MTHYFDGDPEGVVGATPQSTVTWPIEVHFGIII